MASRSARTRNEDALTEAHTWEELAEYERGEVVLRLLRRIADTCLRRDDLRVIEREEWVCSGSSSDSGATRSHHLLLFGHVRHRHREALLALIRQTRLRAVRDLATSVTINLFPGDAVPDIKLHPLAPSLHTSGCILWNRVYFAMRCGILHKLHVREEKIRQRLLELIQETDAAFPGVPSLSAAEKVALASDAAALDAQKRAETLRFYTEDFGQLFTTDPLSPSDGSSSQGSDGRNEAGKRRFLPLSAYMAATKETQVSLTRVTAIVPTVLVAWSARYAGCLEWLQQQLFDDTHLRELRKSTGLSARFAVLTGKDPWVAFAEANGGLLPRPPARRKGFKIDLLQPLPKRAQIVLLNMDEDAKTAQATLEKLQAPLDGWVSPEVDLLSLWSGPGGLQSELATLFNVHTLPFVIYTRPAPLSDTTSTNTTAAQLARVPVISGLSCGSKQACKALYDVPDTPKAADAADADTWHGLSASERARIAKHCGACITEQRLPLLFTASATRDYALRNAAETDPWKAVWSAANSHVCFLGQVITPQDIATFLPELRRLAKLKGFEWGLQIIQRSSPLLSALDPQTPQRLLRGETRCVTCSHCTALIHVDAEVHARCVQCSSADNNNGVLCEHCAFTLRCHPSHHSLLRIPAGQWRPSLPLLWGPSNVVALDLFMGRFVSNASDYHYGVYCDRCRGMIRGTRWKCAVCYQYDLCDACARARRGVMATPPTNALSLSVSASPTLQAATAEKLDMVPPQHDDATHLMLYIPFAQGSQVNKFLQPKCYPSLQAYLNAI